MQIGFTEVQTAMLNCNAPSISPKALLFSLLPIVIAACCRGLHMGAIFAIYMCVRHRVPLFRGMLCHANVRVLCRGRMFRSW